MEAVLAFGGLALAAPVIAVCAAAVVMTSGRPAFFRQARMGRGGRTFQLVKLRSMRPSRGGPRVTARGDDRVTPVGRFLRRTKLDELPELWNVLRGEMSFVGPRPEVPEYVDLSDPRWAAILQARPGLTDPTTLRLRNEEELMAAQADQEAFYREKLQPLKLAGYQDYLERRTWRSDIGVIWSTMGALVPGRTAGRSTSEQGPDLPGGPVGA